MVRQFDRWKANLECNLAFLPPDSEICGRNVKGNVCRILFAYWEVETNDLQERSHVENLKWHNQNIFLCALRWWSSSLLNPRFKEKVLIHSLFFCYSRGPSLISGLKSVVVRHLTCYILENVIPAYWRMQVPICCRRYGPW